MSTDCVLTDEISSSKDSRAYKTCSYINPNVVYVLHTSQIFFFCYNLRSWSSRRFFVTRTRGSLTGSKTNDVAHELGGCGQTIISQKQLVKKNSTKIHRCVRSTDEGNNKVSHRYTRAYTQPNRNKSNKFFTWFMECFSKKQIVCGLSLSNPTTVIRTDHVEKT